ncbi:MAG: hypothetical protein K8S62_12475 [Candidatus Sabulitectum sp.]|nr:hypothetical protein [Candidatus Sabulitectum sp.]
MSRLLSLVVAIGYLVGTIIESGLVAMFLVALFLLLPLSFIWFGDAMGGYTGFAGKGYINKTSPGWAVVFVGWLLLLLLPVLTIIEGFGTKGQ